MKKNVFYAMNTCLLVFLSITKGQAQIPDKPTFKFVAPLISGLEKSSSKVSTDLNVLYRNHLLETKKTEEKVNPGLSHTGLQKYIQVRGDQVVVDIILKEDNSKTRIELEKIGFKISAAYGRIISGTIPIDAISQLETVTDIKFARPAYKPMHHLKPLSTLKKQGIQADSITPVISQGDTAQHSYIARNKYSVNGKGVKVGILSDSYNNLGTASVGVENGELPGPANPFGFETPVQILKDLHPVYGNGKDEGRGMAEIIHDIAPGAELSLHTASEGQADFAQGILALAKFGCKVITDDIGYYEEPFFQDGIIAQAVDQVKKQGVAYFSAAGNGSRQSYESIYRGSDYTPLGPEFGTAHNFSARGSDSVYFQPIKIPADGYIIFDFQWDDPFFSASADGPGAKTDLDIFLLDSVGNILNYSANNNIANGDPFEWFDYYNTSSSTVFYLLITKYSGPDPSHLKYIYYGDGSLYSTTPGIRAPTVVGHSKAKGAIATAAAWYLRTPAYASDTPRIEDFSSVGGVPNYLDIHGNRISPLIRKKPEFTAPDGGNTSFWPPFVYYGDQDSHEDSDSYPNFFGTSAAVAHAAGVAALMIEAQKPKTITPDQIKGILSSNAIDMNNRYLPGFEKGFDFNTGNGFIQADKAVEAVKFPNVYIENLKLEALCSDDPALVRRWKITNPNPFEVEAHWVLSGFDQEGNLVVPPGEKFFRTNTAYNMNLPVPNIALIDWKDNLDVMHTEAAYSTGAKCGEEIVSEKNSDRKLSGVVGAKTLVKPNTAEVYPNPSTKNFRLYLSLAAPRNADISIYSSDGKVLYQKSGQFKGIIDIDASEYKPGLYILKVTQGGFDKTFKLIKR